MSQLSLTSPDLKKFSKELLKMGKNMDSDIKKTLRKSSFIMEAETKKETPVITNRLRGSLTPTSNQHSASVTTNVKYAGAVHDGVAARTIRPRRAKVLAFKVGGKLVFAKSVRQKARVGNPFMKRGGDKSSPKIIKLFSNLLNTNLNKLK